MCVSVCLCVWLHLLQNKLYIYSAVKERDALELSGLYLVWKKLEWLGYNLVKVTR